MKFTATALISAALLAVASTVTAAPLEARGNHHHNHHKGNHIVKGKHFDRVMIIIFENKDYTTAKNDAYYSNLARLHNGVALTNYNGTTHPSQPNYISLISGDTEGTNGDDESNIDRKNIVDLLEAKGVSWKAYQEGYMGNCDKSMRIGTYARKHNPFMSFTNISNDPKRCSKIVNSAQLDIDIENDAVPQFVFFTPDMNSDGHDTDMTYASKWLQLFLEPRITRKELNKNTMFVATFDETDDYSIRNRVLTVLFGPDFKRSSKKLEDDTEYDHYSLLRTIEDNWKLGDLGRNDTIARPIKL
ncbi:phosphoesterase [Radiomyces spectabilis]|uniref:phosphoesterase n=1 Tax=Radiomyces spectabilis TaxID=64574 RepID=UPI00222096FD|nr:phosphoesterase [Radiomyces spectabilis]KAI8379476.1 phosphoesterase [Radiomyces spectabilis]